MAKTGVIAFKMFCKMVKYFEGNKKWSHKMYMSKNFDKMFVLPWYLDAHYHPNTYQINLT